MRGPRYHHLLAATALTLVISLPEGAVAQTWGFGQPWGASQQSRVRVIRVVRQKPPRPPASIKVKSVPLPAERPQPALLDSEQAPALDANIAVEPVPSPVVETPIPVSKPAVNPPPGRANARAAAPLPVVAAAPAVATPPAVANTPAVEPPPPPPKVDPIASLDPSVQPMAEKMRDLLTGKVDKIFANKKERAAVDAFYVSRSYAPVWFDAGVQNTRARAAIARVKASAADGLEAGDYRIAETIGVDSPDALAEAELKLTATLITFTRHLQAGRFPYQRVGHDIEVPQEPPEVADVLTKLADGADVTAAIDAFSPPYEGYQKLKAMLAEMRAKSGGTNKIADGPALKFVAKTPMEDPRVPALRVRLGVVGDPSDLRYDQKLADAVKKFQQANEIGGTGVLDTRTVKELNGPPRDRQVDIILANMERLRWLPRDLGAVHVMVNIPEYQLRVIKNGSLVWNTRVVTGKPTLQTPLLTAEMKYITVNPTWNVPQSIIQKEYLPVLQQDPTALDRIGLKVVYNRDGSVHIYQPPGDGNALGRLRFNFPNRFLVYQHDTPDKHLFAQEARAFSHGCMRVQDPPKYAEVLLGLANPKENWTAEKVRRMFGGAEQDIHFQNTIPVHLTYQTATVEDGQLVLRKDIYGYDARMISALRSERGMIEMVQDRPRETGSGSGGNAVRTARAAPPQQQTSFFGSFFGGQGYYNAPRPVPPQQVRRTR
jgi:L,D-transpeptidase YcbB